MDRNGALSAICLALGFGLFGYGMYGIGRSAGVEAGRWEVLAERGDGARSIVRVDRAPSSFRRCRISIDQAGPDGNRWVKVSGSPGFIDSLDLALRSGDYMGETLHVERGR